MSLKFRRRTLPKWRTGTKLFASCALDKHVNELLRFSHTVFRPDDFMEQVTFDRLEVELF